MRLPLRLVHSDVKHAIIIYETIHIVSPLWSRTLHCTAIRGADCGHIITGSLANSSSTHLRWVWRGCRIEDVLQ